MANDYVKNADGSYTFMLPSGQQVIAAGPEAERIALDIDNRKQGRWRASFESPPLSAMSVEPAPAIGPPPPPPAPPNQSQPLNIRLLPNLFLQEPITTSTGERIDQESLDKPPPVPKLPKSMFAPSVGGTYGQDVQGEPGRRPTGFSSPMPMGAPPIVIPGGEIMAGRTTQHGPGLTQQQQDELAEMSIDQRLALQELHDAERAAQARMNTINTIAAANYRKREQEFRENEALRIQREEAALADVQAADQALGDYTVRPDRFWSDSSGWTKALALLGGILGGTFAARSNSGRNYFSERLDQIIEEDIQKQREELAALERQARAKKDYLTATQIQNERERLSETQMWEQRLQTIAAYARRIEAETRDPIIKARAKLAQLDAQAKLQEVLIGEDQSRRGTETRQYANVPDQIVGGVGTAQTGLDEIDYSPEKTDEWVWKLGDKLGPITQAEADLAPLDSELKAWGANLPGLGVVAEKIGSTPILNQFISPDGRIVQRRINRFLLAYKHAMTGTAASEKEAEQIENAIRGAKTFEELKSAMEDMKASLRRRRQSIEASAPRVAVQKYYQRGGWRLADEPNQARKVNQ